ncbi:MAG: heat-inducible transcription repressor HrcA [Clostridiales bacterium]|nr:heat-inducible transcription repressor HrcA [Clostridiales bacterium]
MKKELSDRKRHILCSAIEDYIKDASPITSGGVKDKHIKEVSTATLRNELNALEAMGYLKQLHTSGGRVPTTEGYRYYVSTLLENFEVDESKLKKVEAELSERTNSLKDILASVAGLVSKATNMPTVIMANGYDKLIIDDIRIIPLIDGEALVLFRTKSGIVNHTIKVEASEKACDDAGKYLTKKFNGKTIGELLEGDILYSSLAEVEGFKNLLESLIISMREFISKKRLDIRGETATNLLDENEHQSVVETKKILNLLGDEDGLVEVIDSEENDITITLGDENEKVEGCALIKAPIVINGTKVASLAVIGPERMDYASIASALKLVMNELKDKKDGDKI